MADDEYGDIVLNTGAAKSFSSKQVKKQQSSVRSPDSNQSDDMDGLDAFLDEDEDDTRTNDDSLLGTSASDLGGWGMSSGGKRGGPQRGGESPSYPNMGLDSKSFDETDD